ncbi:MULTISPECIES: YjdF family protein [unclassified Paenibacillus]|uniref:YjdF family protein n=1 Tax=unclassified Paenibacillus TaxID=185978 RepID=UPI0036427F31
MKLTVYFDDGLQLWVGVVEAEENNHLKACRHMFGQEPKAEEIIAFINFQMLPLLHKTTQAIEVSKTKKKSTANPKRLLKQAALELKQRGGSTYAQLVIKQELEHRKVERKKRSKQLIEQQKELKYALKVQKAKQKHRGK